VTTGAAVAEFVVRARRARPNDRIEAYKVRTFGNSSAISDAIVPLILAREKTGTFALESEFEGTPNDAPKVGDFYVVTHFDGDPALLYRVTEIERVPFAEISHAHVQVEGPNARTVPVWRKIHWAYWGGILRAQGREPREDMPVLFQRFEVIFPER
jgi:uncharacterized protein YhfF